MGYMINGTMGYDTVGVNVLDRILARASRGSRLGIGAAALEVVKELAPKQDETV